MAPPAGAAPAAAGDVVSFRCSACGKCCNTAPAMTLSELFHHDAVYDYVEMAQRQVCWAHLLRDFVRIGQRAGLAGRIGRGLLGAGYVLFRWRKQYRIAAQFAPLRRRVRRLLEQGSAQPYCARTARTCANVLRLWPALWSFLDHPAVPPTNNEAERALRALVIKRQGLWAHPLAPR